MRLSITALHKGIICEGVRGLFNVIDLTLTVINSLHNTKMSPAKVQNSKEKRNVLCVLDACEVNAGNMTILCASS